MAQTKRGQAQQKDLISKLADAGEEAISRLAEMPGGQRIVDAVNGLRVRLDDLAAKVRSIDPLEKRVSELEHRLDALEGKRKAPARKPAAAPKKTA